MIMLMKCFRAVHPTLPGGLGRNSAHVHAPDQTAKEGHDYAGQRQASQKN